ncbi:hypothetical protein [Kaarinaea lacus]
MRLIIYTLLAMFLIACSANQSDLIGSENQGSQNDTAMTEQSPLDQVSEPASNESTIEQQQAPMAEGMNTSPVDGAENQAASDEQAASSESLDAPVEQEAGMSQDSKNMDNNMDVVKQQEEQEKLKSDSKS